MLNFVLHKKQKERILKNLISKFNNNFFYILSQLFFPTLMISTWGVDKFGIWMFLIAIPYSISILNVDLVTPISNKMSFYFNQKKIKELSNIYSNFLIIILLNFFIFLLLFYFVLKNFDFNLQILNELNSYQVKISLIAIILSFLFFLINSIFIVKINYRGKGYITNNIILVFDLTLKILLIISYFFTNNFIILPIIFLILNILKTFVFFLYSSKSGIYFELKYVKSNYILTLIKDSGGHIFELISTILKNNFQVILIGLFFSPLIVGMFSTCRTLFYFLPSRFLSIIFSVFEYEIIEAYSRKQFKKLYKNLKSFYFLFLFLSIFICIFLYLFGLTIYNFWTQNNYEISLFLITLILIDSIIVKFNEYLFLIDKSLNKFFKISIINFFITSISILIIFFYLNLKFDYIIIFKINVICSLILLIILLIYPTILKKVKKKIFNT